MADGPGNTEPSRPEWFAAFLADRGTRKPSAHTMKAYCQDFDAIATLIAGADTSDMSRMSLGDISTDSMRAAFAQYAESHEAATIQRCWSTWNVLCTFLFGPVMSLAPSLQANAFVDCPAGGGGRGPRGRRAVKVDLFDAVS
jgi:site-specific recombinase XerC